MSNINSLHVMFLRALSSHPTLLQCPICDEIGHTNDEFMIHFQSHPMREQVKYLAEGFSVLGITTNVVLPPERLERFTRVEMVTPQTTPPPPLPSSPPQQGSPLPSSPPHQGPYPIRGISDGESVNAGSTGIDLNEIPCEPTGSQDVPIQIPFGGPQLIDDDDGTNDEIDLDLKL